MPYRTNAGLQDTHPMPQICDATTGSVRVAWAHSREPSGISEEERELLALHREEAIHDLFRRLFLRSSAQHLQGEPEQMPRLGAWRRQRSG